MLLFCIIIIPALVGVVPEMNCPEQIYYNDLEIISEWKTFIKDICKEKNYITKSEEREVQSIRPIQAF